MLESMTNEQLLAEIDRLLEGDPAGEMDTQRLEACLALLQQRSPVMEDYDPTQAAQQLQQEHPELFALSRSGKQHSRRWRFLPLAAALAVLLAICVGAYSFSSGWTFYYQKNYDDWVTGDRYAVTQVDYGGTMLPDQTKQQIYDAMVLREVEGGSHYVAEFSFDSLAELEAFIGIDLVKSDQLAVSDVHCTAYFHDNARQWFRIKGFYTLISKDYACRVRFHLSTTPGAQLSHHHLADETSYNFSEYPMDKLDLHAAILSSTTDKTDVVAYWEKDRLAYELHVFGEKDHLKQMKAVLDILQ